MQELIAHERDWGCAQDGNDDTYSQAQLPLRDGFERLTTDNGCDDAVTSQGRKL